MNAYANKAQKNKSQPVANDASKGQADGESNFQRIDNRPEAIAQRKLQEMINNSLQSKRAIQLQAMINNSLQSKRMVQLQAMANDSSNHPILKNLNLATQKKYDANNSDLLIQRKPLNSGVLNVVGERHDESDKLRAWEGQYAREKTGGEYWQEDEFKINIPKPNKEPEETVSVFGDPKILQMANIIHFNTKDLANIVKFIQRFQTVKATRFNLVLSRSQVFNNLQLIQMPLPRLKALGETYKKLKPEALTELADRPDLKDVYDTYTGIGDTLYDELVAGVDAWAINTSLLNKDQANAEALNLAATNAVKFIPIGNTLLTTLFETEDVPEQKHTEATSTVILARSDNMHKAGTIGKASKGVWKIGNQHVKDIKEDILEDAQPEYELMTEDEFFVDFEEWLAQNQDYQNTIK